jgi:hypothetical protein
LGLDLCQVKNNAPIPLFPNVTRDNSYEGDISPPQKIIKEKRSGIDLTAVPWYASMNSLIQNPKRKTTKDLILAP